ncbi:uncharacterized protein SAMN05920897_11724 [Alkalispirochaeta americana]|uniref:S1 motif domain-containing protein n=1 Tax=Alkalispirochaeta americana TaxID=159291 RepID=A0A1N6WDE8_9SPIO|nr:Tex family protein [Alkalispirochaeta americana]SIQ87975.1 uncharacterized protein SAMN05920897_11724 [Alkalispirochaeta americana]
MEENGTPIAGAVAQELGLDSAAVAGALALLAEGATIPFIARYRKERTRGLDEVQLRALADCAQRREALEKRRETILGTIRDQKKLTPDLEKAIRTAGELAVLEDLYLPYRPRRTTRADQARQAGLEPLARALLHDRSATARDLASSFQGSTLDNPQDRLAGAEDLLAEGCAANPVLRGRLRVLFARQAAVESCQAKTKSSSKTSGGQDEQYRDYYSWREPARACPAHRILALFRGETEGALRVTVRPPEDAALREVERALSAEASVSSRERRELFQRVSRDAYRRLLGPSLEKEVRKALRERAEEESTSVFAANLQDMLLAPPLGQRPVLAVDPGFRTGSKVVSLDGTGAVLEYATVYPLPPQERASDAAATLRGLAKRHGAQAVAIGNGTGGREMEHFLRSLELRDPAGELLPLVRVNEAGASVYSASPQARQEMPDLDVTIRGAVSIGRRLQDPLSELVKIDPAAVGVGQYQHDIDPGRLQEALGRTLESCVNAVGVEINTAGPALLARVSGLGPTLARAIVSYRTETGPFPERAKIQNVPGIGPRTWEQAAGFLRCRTSAHPLDRTGIHPESYPLVERMARERGCSLRDFCENPSLREGLDPEGYAREAGAFTMADILAELAMPGRDPRETFEAVSFREDVREIGDLSPGMALSGVVTNVTRFGAFVDIGVHRDGLVHLSHLADHYVRDPRDVVRVGQVLEVEVLAVDTERQRIELKRRSPGQDRKERQ